MRAFALSVALAGALFNASLSSQQLHPDELKLKPRIDKAIAEGVEVLLDAQLRDGSFGITHDHVGGQTALCAYALLKCGVASTHPALQRAFAYLDNIVPNRTYAVGCMLLAYSATGKPEHKARLRELLAIMVSFQHKFGTYGYPHNAPDLSNTQYAALGLWAANKAGLKVPTTLWDKLAKGTLAHQEAFHMAKVRITGRTGVGQREIAGFQYRANGAKTANNATGTMTTAGISILKICEIGLGKKLKGKARKEFNRAMEAGLSWLDLNFSVKSDQKPKSRGGKWLLYYLYGMERVGGLTRREQFGDHWWYVDGAKEILGRQKNGNWGQLYDTCFALLFLRRATITAPMTGSGASAGATRHLFSAGGAGDDIELRAAGQQPLMIYIQTFGEPLLSQHTDFGLRILRVEYLSGDQVLGQLASDPTKGWTELETFVHRHPALPHGKHTITARVIALDPSSPPGEIGKTITINSKPMEVRIRDVVEPWMTGLAEMQKDNELKGMKFQVTGSSQPKNAAKAADGLTHTHWLADAGDQAPTLTFTFEDPVKTRWMVLTQPLQKRDDINRMGLIRQVEVSCNGKRPFLVDLHPNPLAPTEFKLPKTLRVRTMTVTVKKRGGKPGLPVGFAEIVLEGKRK